MHPPGAVPVKTPQAWSRQINLLEGLCCCQQLANAPLRHIATVRFCGGRQHSGPPPWKYPSRSDHSPVFLQAGCCNSPRRSRCPTQGLYSHDHGLNCKVPQQWGYKNRHPGMPGGKAPVPVCHRVGGSASAAPARGLHNLAERCQSYAVWNRHTYYFAFPATDLKWDTAA